METNARISDHLTIILEFFKMDFFHKFCKFIRKLIMFIGAAVAEWLSSWLVEQEDRVSIPGLATWIFRDWLSPASKSRYGWNTAEAM